MELVRVGKKSSLSIAAPMNVRTTDVACIHSHLLSNLGPRQSISILFSPLDACWSILALGLYASLWKTPIMVLAERGREMITIVAVLVSLASIAVLLRIVVRFKLRLGFGIDDYLCFAAMGFMYGMFVELVLCEYEGPATGPES